MIWFLVPCLPRLPIGAHRWTSLINARQYGRFASSTHVGNRDRPTIASSSVHGKQATNNGPAGVGGYRSVRMLRHEDARP